MSERFNIKDNKNESKNTRLPVAKDFANYRFNRDEIAHVSRYLYVVEGWVNLVKKIGRPISVLDIGCGDVYLARVLQSSFVVKKTDIIKTYTGVDIDYKCLQNAQKTLPKSFKIHLLAGDVTEGTLSQFGDKEFDVVTCLEVIEHIKPEYVPVLLSEIRRLCCIAYISTPNFDGGTGKIPEDHIKEWGYEELKFQIEKAGIAILQEVGVFCNLGRFKALSKEDKAIKKIYNYLENKVDKNFLSIILAKLSPKEAQNILRVCKC